MFFPPFALRLIFKKFSHKNGIFKYFYFLRAYAEFEYEFPRVKIECSNTTSCSYAKITFKKCWHENGILDSSALKLNV